MRNDSLSHGKKSVPKNGECGMKTNRTAKRTDELSNSGLEFHKPLNHKDMEDSRK